eukprot:scaffold1398_cov116-Cylindrotheca_fusiformis.AAC.2
MVDWNGKRQQSHGINKKATTRLILMFSGHNKIFLTRLRSEKLLRHPIPEASLNARHRANTCSIQMSDRRYVCSRQTKLSKSKC